MIPFPSISKTTILDFEKLIGREVLSHVENFDAFMSDNYTNLLEYYSGQDELLKPETITALENLHKNATEIEGKMIENYVKFNRFDLSNFLVYMQEIQTQIDYLRNIGKFLRSARYSSFFENAVSIEYTMGDGDTLEKISRQRSLNFNDDWIDIARKNNLEEIDYNAQEGGKVLNVGKRNTENQFLLSVVDYLIGERVYGIDLDKEFTFENNDIKTLSYRDTFVQSVKILAQLSKGEIPRFPDIGVSADAVIGKNIGSLSLPFVEREMRETFGSDDTIVDFVITNISREASNLYIEFSVRSYYDFVYNGTLKQRT